jgi:hypothetical protein
MRLKLYQINLGAFIILCLIAGSGTGLYLQQFRPRRTAHASQFLMHEWAVVKVWWRGWGKRDDDLAYLLAYPDAGMSGWIADDSSCVRIRGRNRIAEQPDRKFWICVITPKGIDVRPIDGDCPAAALKDYKVFRETAFWQERLRPALIEESRRFDRWWFETYGTKNPGSRFTPQETWDEWRIAADAER